MVSARVGSFFSDLCWVFESLCLRIQGPFWWVFLMKESPQIKHIYNDVL